MKTEYKTNRKDNIATAIVLLSLFIGTIAVGANSQTVNLNHTVVAPQQMAAIVITAQRIPIETMNAIVVRASRHADIVVAAK